MADIMCNDNRFEVIGRAKEHLLEATNIDTSPDEMAVLDSFLFRCWQMGWLDRYDDTADAIMPMTLENAIDFLDKIGWRAEHDRIMSTPQWIPCEEKLPDDGEDVLISYRYKVGEGDTSHVYIALTSYGRIWSDSIFGDRKDWRQPFQFFYSNYEVIAWMPLPKPYDGERRDDD